VSICSLAFSFGKSAVRPRVSTRRPNSAASVLSYSRFDKRRSTVRAAVLAIRPRASAMPVRNARITSSRSASVGCDAFGGGMSRSVS